MGGPAAWLGVGDRPLSPCCWCLRVGRVSDARSSLICAGWLPQDGLFEWNGHHCLRKRTWPARGLVVHRSRVDPVPRAEFRIQPAGKDIVDDLVRGRLLETMALWCAAGGCGQVGDLPDGGAAGGRGGCGVKGGRRPSRQRSRQRPLRPEGRPHRLRGAPQRCCCRSWSVHGLGVASRP